MSATRMTYQALKDGFYKSRLGKINMSTGAADTTAGDDALADIWFSNASRTVWEMPAGKDWVWPWTVQTLSGATLTNGAIPWSSIDYGMWFSVWTADPRPDGAVASFLRSTWDADGIRPADTTLGSYFVFYIPRCPEYSSTAWSGSTAYAVDDLMLYTDGDVYRCKTATSAGESPVSAAAKWVLQPVYRTFQTTLELFAMAQFFFSNRDSANAAKTEADAYAELSDRFDNIYSNTQNYTPASIPIGMFGTWR